MVLRDLQAAGCEVEYLEVPCGWRVIVRRDDLKWVAEAEELLAAFLEVETGVRSVAGG